jgi:hypothetical protein
MVTINMEPIKHIAKLNNKKSILLEGKCDGVIQDLLKDLGWEQEFEDFTKETKEKAKL